MKPEATPWRALLAAAIGLGVSPREFWRLSLREWRALSAPLLSADALSRTALDSLSTRFPDLLHDKY